MRHPGDDECGSPGDTSSAPVLGTPRDYLRVVERYYVRLRRHGLMLSATDVDRVEAWRQAGLPLDVVCRGLAAGAERFRAREGDDARLPDTLAYFEVFVEEAAAEFGAEPGADAVTGAGAEAREVPPAQSPRAASGVGGPEAPGEAMDALLMRLSAEERASLEHEVDARLESERHRLGKRGAALRRFALLEDVVAERFGPGRPLPE